jgi:hypothetical protein
LISRLGRAVKTLLIPDDILRRERAGESPVELWRTRRNLTQDEPAWPGSADAEGKNGVKDFHRKQGQRR